MPYNPGTASRATTATLSTAFQADQRMRQTCAELYEYVRGIAYKAILSEACRICLQSEPKAKNTGAKPSEKSCPHGCLEPTVTDQREVMAVPRHYDDVHQTTVFRTYNGTATAPYTMREVATANRQYVTKHRLKPTSRLAHVLTFPSLPKRKKDVRCTTPYHEKHSPAGQDRLFRHARLTI